MADEQAISKSDNEEKTHNLIPPALAVTAMRDNGYRNTTYALAELVDNAIQANATHIEIHCCERQVAGGRVRRNIDKIAVLDNGKGMNAESLRVALQFGNGAYLNNRSGIGRFGMGLPSSSISQCRKVEVWTWQGDHNRPFYSYIDIDEVEKGQLTTVPAPEIKEIPALWKTSARTLGESGTLVVWSNLDRCLWKTAQAIINNSEFTVGRMYRKYIANNHVRIRMLSFLEDSPEEFHENRQARVNDPIYRMVPSSTPSPYDKHPMFKEHGDNWEVHSKILANGKEHTVTTRFTIAKEKARPQRTSGSLKHGKHAERNIGISLIRANRELELDTSLVIQYDPRERWWGVEIEFPPSLDEIFGVTNNKQSARNFTDIASEIENILADEKSLAGFKEELNTSGDPRGPLINIAQLINKNLREIRKLIRIQGQSNTRKAAKNYSSERIATRITQERKKAGHEGESDKDEQLPPQERKDALTKELIATGLSEDNSSELAAQTIDLGLKYIFVPEDLSGSTFFEIKLRGGEIIIKLNINHPVYNNLVEVLEDLPIDSSSDTDNESTNGSTNGKPSQEELLDRLTRAREGLKLLLMAWARYEDEASPITKKNIIQDTRFEWGKYAAQFLRDE